LPERHSPRERGQGYRSAGLVPALSFAGSGFATPCAIAHHARMEARTISTPCIRNCTLDRDGVCIGCHRTVDEIIRWRDMGEAERLRLMREVLPLRARRDEPRE
jgi:predicted Fe-S protein YdhL (DUF1289 family)